MLGMLIVIGGTCLLLCIGAGIDDLISYLKGEY